VKIKRYIGIFSGIACLCVALCSCGNLLETAFRKDSLNVNANTVSDFISVAGDSSISLSWTLPSYEGFGSVVLFRKTGSYPLSYTDPAATLVYQGADTSYSDTSVAADNLYCYSIYSVNTRGVYSNDQARTEKSIYSDFTLTVRKRCFYLVGGASDSDDPYNTLVAAVDAFDPETDIEYPNVATLPIPRYSCAAASADGKIFVFGGLDSERNLVPEVDVLDVCSPTWPSHAWSRATNMPFPRYSLRAENVDDRIFVFGGSTSLSPWPWAAMTDYNHEFDPYTHTWTVDESKVPKLQQWTWMNIASGAFSGHLIYGVGRYANSANFLNYVMIHNMDGNFYTTVNDADITTRASAAGVVYHKGLSGNVDLNVFFVIGGCNNSGTNFEPLKAANGVPLTAVASCCYMKLPLATVVADQVLPMTGRNITTARAYAEAEFHINASGNGSLYVFCGRRTGSTDVLNSYEKIAVDDALAFPTGWTETPSTTLSPRFAFDIAKVIF
jgi:hypothetical protein